MGWFAPSVTVGILYIRCLLTLGKCVTSVWDFWRHLCKVCLECTKEKNLDYAKTFYRIVLIIYDSPNSWILRLLPHSIKLGMFSLAQFDFANIPAYGLYNKPCCAIELELPLDCFGVPSSFILVSQLFLKRR